MNSLTQKAELADVYVALAKRAEAGGDAMLSADVWRMIDYPAQRLKVIDGGLQAWVANPDLRISIDAQETALPEPIQKVVKQTIHDSSVNPPTNKEQYAASAVFGTPRWSWAVAPTEALARLAARLLARAAKLRATH